MMSRFKQSKFRGARMQERCVLTVRVDIRMRVSAGEIVSTSPYFFTYTGRPSRPKTGNQFTGGDNGGFSQPQALS